MATDSCRIVGSFLGLRSGILAAEVIQMTLGEKIKEQRTVHGLSQETLAAQMGVSRQAVTKWEADQSAPSSEKLIALAKLFHISLDELIGNEVTPSQVPQGKQPNPILRANLTRMAITLQAAFGYAAAQHLWYTRALNRSYMAPTTFSVVLLFLCSIWMVSNHRFEPDLKQRRKNTRIELLYCLVQLGFGYLIIYAGIGLIGAILMMVTVFVYIIVINPKYMNRKLTK